MLILMQSKKVNRKLECLCLNITKFRCYKARSLGKNQQTSPNNLSVFCACDTSGNFPYIITTFRQRKGGTLSIFTQVRLTSTEKLKKNPLVTYLKLGIYILSTLKRPMKQKLWSIVQ